MPSPVHENPIKLTRLDPSLPVWLRSLLDGETSTFDHARLCDPNVWLRTYQADAMVLCCDARDRPVRALAFGVQRERDREKLDAWSLDLAHLKQEYGVKTSLVTLFPDPAVADWYRDQIKLDAEDDLQLRLRCVVPADVPLITDVAEVTAWPARALLSVLCHGDEADVEQMYPAVAAALAVMDEKTKIQYHYLMVSELSRSALARWKAFLMPSVPRPAIRGNPVGEDIEIGPSRGEAHASARRQLLGELIGMARGVATSVLEVLATREISVPDPVREQILTCQHINQLKIWVTRAVTATAAEEVVAE